jgi:DNA primase
VIGQETIDRVRREARIVAVVGETVKLVKKGRSHVGLCPFHKEKTPSFHVNEERGFYHCFGCSVSGDAIKFVMETRGMPFVDAVRMLAEREGIEIVETGSDRERRQQQEARRRQDELYEIGGTAAAFFERMLREHPLAGHARAELARRGLVASTPTGAIADALQAFRVGYAPHGWSSLVRHLTDSGAGLRAAETVGLVAPRRSGQGHYDRFRHRLMFAVIDAFGRVIAFSGRSLAEPTAEELGRHGLEPAGAAGEPPAKYINSPESPIYKKREALFGLYQARQAIKQAGECVLVEGNFDVVSLHARGIANVVAPLGTAFTAEQARQIKRHCPKLVVLFDGDAAGRRATRAAREPCREAGLLARVAVVPAGTDPDELVRREGPEALARIVASSRSMLEHLIETTLDSGFAADDAQARAQKIREVTELLAAEEDPAVRAMARRHADAIAERLGVADVRTFQALAAAVEKALAGPSGAAPRGGDARVEQPRPRDRRAEVGREILGVFLDFPELADTEPGTLAAAALEGDAAAALGALRHAMGPAGRVDPELVLAKLPPSIHPFALARLAAPRHERLDDAMAALTENVKKLHRLEQRVHDLENIEALRRAQLAGDEERQHAVLVENVRRARARRGL